MARGTPEEHLCPVELVRPVVACLPRAAAALDVLLAADRAQRTAQYDRVTEVAVEVESARVAAMSDLSRVRPTRRVRAVRLCQSVSLLVGIMVATARVAAEGVNSAVSIDTAARSREVLRLCDESMLLVLPTQRARRPSEEMAWEQGRLHQLDSLVADVSAVLDELMVDLVRMAAAEVR